MKILFRAVSTAAVVTALIAPRVLAQDATPAPANPTPAVPTPAATPVIAPAETPAIPATNTPAKKAMPRKTTAKPAAKKSAPKIETKSEPVLSPEPGVAKQNNVNVRGQASINSEVVAHLKKNDPVTVLEEITLKKPKQDEPSRWYKIALPSSVGVWVNANYIDTANNTVKATRLNMRGGPGENYSILGRIEKGTTVKPLDTKNGWIKIEPPTNSFAFVAAHLIERQPAAAIAATAPKPETTPAAAITPTPVPPTTANVPSNPPPAVAEVTPVAPPATAPVTAPPATPAPAPAEATEPATPAPAVTPAPAEATTNAPIETVRKVVRREGILKGSVSIQAPTYFELRSLDTGKAMDYVFSPSTNLMLKEFKGQRVIVTGEEILDERWQHTPVIVADELQVVR
jgi:uncharacterized protein YgiM (DUF1202 family)